MRWQSRFIGRHRFSFLISNKAPSPLRSAGALQKFYFPPTAAELNLCGSLTFPEANNTNHTAPETEDSKPDMIVSVRGVIPRNDQPAIAVAKLQVDRKSTRLNSSHIQKSRMPSSA